MNMVNEYSYNCHSCEMLRFAYKAFAHKSAAVHLFLNVDLHLTVYFIFNINL